MQDNPQRALTHEQKHKIVVRLVTAWMKQPELRLGQLISNSLVGRWDDNLDHVLYNVEDTMILDWIEEYITRYENKH